MKPKSKWKFAIGTTSRVPHSGGLHYFIADFDDYIFPLEDQIVRWIVDPANIIILQKTEHGWHLYTDVIFSFDKLVANLKLTGADAAWIDIGKERGYFFLADKSEIDFPYPVEHMVIHYGKEKTRNTKTP
jgi:hypothetical protein